MLVKVLKTFPYAHDGMTFADYEAGAIEDVHDDHVEGLAAEGFVGEPDDGEEGGDPEVEIPAEWSAPKFPWFTLRALAAKISGASVPNKPAAVAIVEAELARREKAAG